MIIIVILTPLQPRRHKGKRFAFNCITLMFANGLASVAGRRRHYAGNNIKLYTVAFNHIALMPSANELFPNEIGKCDHSIP